jgi:hypothetical protein
MKTQNCRSHCLAPFAAILFSLLGLSVAQAQHTFEQYNGGTGQWDAGFTADWNNNQTYVNSIARDTSATPATSYAYFGSAPGTITVDDSKSSTNVTFGGMEFNSGNQAGTWVFNGDTLDDIANDNTATVMQIDGGQIANVTFNNTINIAPNPTNGSSLFINGGSGTTLTIGNINISSTPITYTDNSGIHTAGAPYLYNGNTVNSQTVLLFGANGTTTILAGNYTTDTGLFGGLLIGNYGDASEATATYIIKGALDEARNGNKEFDFGSGNIILETSNTGTGDFAFVGAGANLLQTMLTAGAQTIGNNIYAQGTSNAEIGGSTADTSTYTGTISAGAGNGELDLHAAAGGTVIFSNTISGDNGVTSKDGAGTVILNQVAGNTWTSYNTDVFEMKAGTTLIMNTSGSAFGGGPQGSIGPVFAQIDSGATLGGKGISTQQIVAMASDSVIAPGTSTSIGTLSLTGGLAATNGLTLDFKLTGADHPAGGIDNDFIETSTFALGGPVTVNFTTLDTVETDNPYFLIGGTANWTEANGTTFYFNTPAGYELNSAYGTGGYLFDTTNDQFSVEFAAVPEPSTYALMGLGLVALAGIRRWKRRAQAL